MYEAIGPNLEGMFIILDPEGVSICVVMNKDEAAALLSHLNR